MMVRIAIDPGKGGGIAVRYDMTTVTAIPMPETAHGLANFLYGASVFDNAEAVVEKVHAMPTDGRSSAFTFGENFGMIQGVLAALKIPYRLVTPSVWQKKVGSLPDDRPTRKRALKAFAQQRFPHISVTLKTADALAILAVEF